MSYTLTVRDETAAGQALGEFDLDFLTERVTVRELIRSRVYQEVKDHNVRAAQATAERASADFADAAEKKGGRSFQGLVQPSPAERVLNAPRTMRAERTIDWQRQFEVAVEAFARNGFLILVGERQARALEEEIEILPGTAVSFVKLVPLVGG